MKIIEVGYVNLRESPLHQGSRIYRHTLIADGFNIPNKALSDFKMIEHQIGAALGGPVILGCKSHNEMVLVFTIEVEHHTVEPSSEPVKVAEEKLVGCLKKLSLT